MTGRCELCGRHGETETHHIFNGAYRKKSEEYGAVIPVCRICHNAIHAKAELRKVLKLKYQIKIEKEHGLTDEQFIQLFGKSYKIKTEVKHK